MRGKTAISAILSLMLCIPVSANFAETEEHWAQKSIDRMTSLGFVNGNEYNEFMPENFITRAELCAIINRITRATKQTGTDFSDVDENSWYKKDIDIAVTAGYISGYTDGTMRPENYITRAEAAVLISRVFPNKFTEKKEFGDSVNIGDWAKNAIFQLVAAGLLSGYEDTTFRPDEFITRAEAVTIMDKAVGEMYSKRETVLDKIIDANVIVLSGGNVFENVTINANVYITPSADSGEIRFKNSTVNGSVYSNGSYGTLVVENSKMNSLSLSGGETELVLAGASSVNEVDVYSTSKLTALDYTGTEISELNINADTTVGLNVKKIFVGSKANVNIINGVTADELMIDENLLGVKITSNGKIKRLLSKSSAEVNGVAVKAGYSTTGVTSSSDGGSMSYTKTSSGGGGGGGGGGGRPTSGAAEGEKVDYKITGVSVNDYEITKTSEKTYALSLLYDTESIELVVECTPGARLRINDMYADSGSPRTIGNIPSGQSDIVINLLDGLEVLDTYVITITKGREASEESLAELNRILRETTDPDAATDELLKAFSNANINNAVLILFADYINAYPKYAASGNLNQKEIIAMIDAVNKANESVLSTALGVKNDGGYVYESKLNVPSGGLYEITIRYVATVTHENSKISAFINGVRYDSDVLDVSTSAGWTEAKLVVKLMSGKNNAEFYAENIADGNYGIIIEKVKLSDEKIIPKSITTPVKKMSYIFTETVLDDGTWVASYDQNSPITGEHSIGGGGITFTFNSDEEQDVVIVLRGWRGNPNEDPIVAFLNPISTPREFTAEMTEGVDYSPISDAFVVNTVWTNGNKEIFEIKTPVHVQKGQNIVWLPSRALARNTGDGKTTVCMYPFSGGLYANRSTNISSITVAPMDFDVSAN